MVMENPRYLVTAANTPTILKEGTRYNPLHVAIISKHLNMCKLILQTIEKPQFIELCNGPCQDHQSTQEASMILLESYLNMPDKPRSETPLHFAAKLGLKDIIELLISYPICKMKPNSEGMLPKDVSSFHFSVCGFLIMKLFSFLDHLSTCVWHSGVYQGNFRLIARTFLRANLACDRQHRASCHWRTLQHKRSTQTRGRETRSANGNQSVCWSNGQRTSTSIQKTSKNTSKTNRLNKCPIGYVIPVQT